MKIGYKVQLKPQYAKWHLDNPDIYYVSDEMKLPKRYENEFLLHMACCLGEPVYGVVLSESSTTSNCWKVKFKVDDLVAEYYVERSHVNVPKIDRLLIKEKK